MPETKRSRQERLDAILAKLAPRAVAYEKKFGRWPSATSFLEDGTPVSPDESVAQRLAKLFARDSTLNKLDRVVVEAATRTVRASDDAQRGAPYTITTIANNGRRVAVNADSGDIVSGSGADLEAALADLEAKL